MEKEKDNGKRPKKIGATCKLHKDLRGSREGGGKSEQGCLRGRQGVEEGLGTSRSSGVVNDRKGRRGRSGRKGWLWRLTGKRYRSRQRKSRVAGLSNGVYRVGKRERKKERETPI